MAWEAAASPARGHRRRHDHQSPESGPADAARLREGRR